MWKVPSFRTLGLAALLALACTASSKVVVLTETGDRELFLRRVDAAMAARNADAILALSDVERWRSSGHPPPAPSALTLPPAPISRVQEDSSPADETATQALYQDGSGKRWRLRLQRAAEANAWRIVLLSEPCPRRGGMARGLEWGRKAATAATAENTAPTIWTPLECWPLPL